jgi:aspartate-semialdehyde dehydrogenase
MTRTPDTLVPRQNVPLEEIDLAAMETISGGCQACAQQQQQQQQQQQGTQAAGQASQIIGQIIPLISQFTKGAG